MKDEKYYEINERIKLYYLELLEETLEKEDVDECFRTTYPDVFDRLYKYAREGNYWWEKRDITMAYYQMQVNTLVVPFNAFNKYYKKLMGRKYNFDEMYDPESRKKALEEAKEKYNKKMKKR